MTDITLYGDDRLDKLATDINREHQAAQDALSAGLEHARLAGGLLNEAKALCPHGAWLPWLEANFEGSVRTAQAYMRVASRWEELAASNAQRVAHMPYREALLALADTDSEPRDGLVVKERRARVALEAREETIATGRATLRCLAREVQETYGEAGLTRWMREVGGDAEESLKELLAG